MIKTFVSSGAFSEVRALPELIQVCQEAGISNVELASGLGGGDEDVAGQLLDLGGEFQFLVHNYFPAPEEPFVLNLADTDERNRDRSVAFCKEAISLCKKLSVPFYSVHAGFVASLKAEDLGRPERQQICVSESERERAEERFLASVNELALFGAECGVDLLIENNVHAVEGSKVSHLLMVSGDDCVRFFEQVDNKRVKMLMDVGHLAVSSHWMGFELHRAFEACSSQIGALHLSENDLEQDTNDLCRSDSWFWDVVNANCSRDVVAVLEAYRLSSLQVSEQLDLIQRKITL